MWTYHNEVLSANSARYTLLDQDKPLSYREVIQLWKNNERFCDFFNATLSASPLTAFFWEVKPVTSSGVGHVFEFVLTGSSVLPEISADQNSFSRYFKGGNVVSFPNLGGDAVLIVPECRGEIQHYAHLAAFVRNAPASQVNEFWKEVGTQFEKAIGSKPKWLSTAGLGVYRLHVRIDSQPKYYRYGPYKNP